MNAEIAFDRALHRVFGLEGGYSDHDDDPGGATNWGITQAVFDAWRADRGLPGMPVALLREEDAREIYRDRYWNRLHCDEVAAVDERVAWELFEAGVNCGRGTAVRFLQRALNVLARADDTLLAEDGCLGPVTMASLKQCVRRGYAAALLAAMNGEQYVWYRGLVERDNRYRSFARGWMKRVLTDVRGGG